MADRRNREWVIAVILRATVVASLVFLQPHFVVAEDIATGGGITRLIDAQLKEWKSSGTVAGCEVLYTVG